MIKNKLVAAIFAALLSVLLIMTAFSGCSGNSGEPEPTEPVFQTEPAEPTEAETDAGMQDGDRFETTIMLEGMEETVRYEHVRNETAGFEMDFDYDSLERTSGSDSERFVSRYDDPEAPENYIEVKYEANDADSVAASVNETLSGEYDTVVKEDCTLDGAGQCVQISASGDKDGSALQTAYIIPAGDGCIVATVHNTVESAEGFGVRFTAMINTLSVID